MQEMKSHTVVLGSKFEDMSHVSWFGSLLIHALRKLRGEDPKAIQITRPLQMEFMDLERVKSAATQALDEFYYAPDFHTRATKQFWQHITARTITVSVRNPVGGQDPMKEQFQWACLFVLVSQGYSMIFEDDDNMPKPVMRFNERVNKALEMVNDETIVAIMNYLASTPMEFHILTEKISFVE